MTVVTRIPSFSSQVGQYTGASAKLTPPTSGKKRESHLLNPKIKPIIAKKIIITTIFFRASVISGAFPASSPHDEICPDPYE